MAASDTTMVRVKKTLWVTTILCALTGGALGTAPASVAATDRPDTRKAAKVASPKARWLSDTIDSAGDQDWYRFTTTSTRTVRVVLGSLPADYTATLHSSRGTLLAGRNRPGVEFEEIIKRLRAGTYFVKVSSPSGETSTSPYRVRFHPYPAGIKVLSRRKVVVGTDTFIEGELLNTFASTRQLPMVHVTYYNAAGKVIGRDRTWALVPVLGARKKSVFAFSELPAKLHRYTLTTKSEPSTLRPLSGMALTPGASSVDEDGNTHFVGDITNTNFEDVPEVAVIVAIYDRLGRLRGGNVQYTTPKLLRAGEQGRYDVPVLAADVSRMNRFTLSVVTWG